MKSEILGSFETPLVQNKLHQLVTGFQLDLQKLTERLLFEVNHSCSLLPIFVKRLVLFHFFFNLLFLLRLRRLPLKDKKQCYIFINKYKAL